MAGEGLGGPARGAGRGSPRHPDFEPGNTFALRHGVYAAGEEQLIRRRAREEALAAELLDERPDLAGFANAWHVTDWCREVCYVLEIDELLGRLGPIGAEDGGVRDRLRRERRAHARRANEAARELGLGPRNAIAYARERLEAANAAHDLGAVIDAGRRTRGFIEATTRGDDDDAA